MRALSINSPLSLKYRDNNLYCLKFKRIAIQDKSWCLTSLRQVSYGAMHLISLETLIPWRHFLHFTTLLVKYFSLQENIVNDQETQITGELWTALINLMGIKLKFSTANHPQTDGQIESIFLEEIPIKIGLQLIIIGQICWIQCLFSTTYIDPQPGWVPVHWQPAK